MKTSLVEYGTKALEKELKRRKQAIPLTSREMELVKKLQKEVVELESGTTEDIVLGELVVVQINLSWIDDDKPTIGIEGVQPNVKGIEAEILTEGMQYIHDDPSQLAELPLVKKLMLPLTKRIKHVIVQSDKLADKYNADKSRFFMDYIYSELV